MNPSIDKPRVLNTIPEAAKRLRICPAMIYKLMNQRKLASVKIGSRRMIPESEIIRIAQQGA